MQTEREQLTEADRATALLVQGDAEQKREAAEVLRALANLGHTDAVRAAAIGALLQLLSNNGGH
jgi:cyanophycinase-like exopeptidase